MPYVFMMLLVEEKALTICELQVHSGATFDLLTNFAPYCFFCSGRVERGCNFEVVQWRQRERCPPWTTQAVRWVAETGWRRSVTCWMNKCSYVCAVSLVHCLCGIMNGIWPVEILFQEIWDCHLAQVNLEYSHYNGCVCVSVAVGAKVGPDRAGAPAVKPMPRMCPSVWAMMNFHLANVCCWECPSRTKADFNLKWWVRDQVRVRVLS